MSWSPNQYSTFEKERTRPVRDLVSAVETSPVQRAVDIGCGPGNSTEVLAERFPDATIRGLDSSPEMIEAARARLPALGFDVADVSRAELGHDVDVILANAVLQWVPDHAALLPRLASCLSGDGSLAVQMPDNLDEPAHRLMRQVAADARFASKLSQAATARQARMDVDWYYGLLKPHVRSVDIWRTTYYHVLSGGTDAIVEWFKGSGLRPFLSPLSVQEQQDYLSDYRNLLTEAYPLQQDGSVLLPFPRLFFVARR